MIEINYMRAVNDLIEAESTNELKNMKVAALKEMAKEMNIRGWRTMKKDELVEAIENHEQSQSVPEEVVTDTDVNTQTEGEVVSEVNHAPRKNNKRMLEYNGKTQTLNAWAKELGIRHQTLYNRIVMKGMDVTEAFEKGVKKNG